MAEPTVRRIGWLHFWNDFTLDFVTPLLPAGVPVAWLGVMEGAADAAAQALKPWRRMGPWLLIVGLGWDILAGLTNGAE
jgi:hypothetical protein